jgi:hypothetical protein
VRYARPTFKYRDAFSWSEADEERVSGKFRSAGRVDGGGLTSPASDLADVEDGVRRDEEDVDEVRLCFRGEVDAYRWRHTDPNTEFGIAFWRFT